MTIDHHHKPDCVTTRVFLPWEFINQTRGLFGNWSFDARDDFTLPDGEWATGFNYNDTGKNSKNAWKNLDENFASQCKGNCQKVSFIQGEGGGSTL